MLVQPGLCQTWSEPKLLVFSCTGSYDKFFIKAIKRLRDLYGDNVTKPDDVDLFTGGMLETIPEGPGELFQHIILDQFLRIRHGDRFWFENTEYRYE